MRKEYTILKTWKFPWRPNFNLYLIDVSPAMRRSLKLGSGYRAVVIEDFLYIVTCPGFRD
jgi:hypothetical protein